MPSETKILLVEDERIIASTLAQALEEEGYEVRVAVDGNEALTILDTANFDGIITDIRLGSGPDGWHVARVARELNTSVPIVYMSADSAHLHPTHGVPNTVMLSKPFTASKLFKAVKSLM